MALEQRWTDPSQTVANRSILRGADRRGWVGATGWAQKYNIEYFFTLKKTLESHPELADPAHNEPSVRGGETSIWDDAWRNVEMGAKLTPMVSGIPSDGSNDLEQELSPTVAKRRNRFAKGRLSRLTQPGASDVMQKWDAPEVLPSDEKGSESCY
jgi:hypothetical protein